MQPIERYGVAALLFLIVTIGAVVLWDQSETQAAPPGEDEVAAVDGLAGVMLTFDDFVIGMEQFGHRIHL